MSVASQQEVAVDYSVKVQIWECRNVKASGIRPYVKVTLFDSKKLTPSKRSAENPYWNEIFLFHVKKAHTLLLSEIINFQLMSSRNLLSRDQIIGAFDLQLKDVYAYENHSMQKKWLLLTNEYHEFVGYLKITVSIVGPNESFPPEEISDESETDISENVIRPNNVSLHPVQLFTKLYEVCHVPDFSDALNRNFPQCNLRDFRPVIEVSFDGVKSKFKRLKRWQNHVVNEGAVMNIHNYPSIAKKIYISVCDSKHGSRSSGLLARCSIDLNSFKKDRTSINLSSPLETSFGPKLLNLYAQTENSDYQAPEAFIFMGRVVVEFRLTVSSELKHEKERHKAFAIAPLARPVSMGAVFRCVFILQELNLINELVSEDYVRVNVSWADCDTSSLPLRIGDYFKSM